MEFTINIGAILAWLTSLGYTGVKIASAIWITRREFQYPIWDRHGIQVERRLHHKIRAFIRNLLLNPEWAAVKLVLFVPVGLFTGMRFWHKFAPWRVQSPPSFCKRCRDKGRYYTGSFMRGCKGNWHQCECEQLPRELPNCTCMVCLDRGQIGPNRPCPHCERRSPGTINAAIPRVIAHASSAKRHPTPEPMKTEYVLNVYCRLNDISYYRGRHTSVTAGDDATAIQELMAQAEALFFHYDEIICTITKTNEGLHSDVHKETIYSSSCGSTGSTTSNAAGAYVGDGSVTNPKPPVPGRPETFENAECAKCGKPSESLGNHAYYCHDCAFCFRRNIDGKASHG